MASQPAFQNDERTSLLGDDSRVSAAADLDAMITKDSFRPRTQLATILFVCVLYFNTFLNIAPEMSIQESIICEAYYNSLHNDVSTTATLEHDCTINAVQGELSLLNQVYVTLHQLPGLLSLPYGILADRIGRKKVLILSIVGIVLCEAFRLLVTWSSGYIPLRTIWLAPLFRVIGGGDVVSATVLLTALADVYTKEDLAILFARVASVAIAFEIVSPLVGTAIMLKTPWISVILGFATFLLGALVTIALLPETLIQSEDRHESRTPLKPGSLKFGNLKERIVEFSAVFRQSLITLFAEKNVVFLMFGFFAVTIGTMVGLFKLQYLRKRFGWSYSYTASILTIRSLVTLVVLLVIIPAASKILVERVRVVSARKDLILTRASAALLAAGTLLLCISDGAPLVILSLVVFGLGTGFMTLGKSLLLSLGPGDMAGTLLSAMTMSSSLGAVVAGPLIIMTFNWGLGKGGVWLSLPLFLVSLLYLVTLGFVCTIQVPNEHLDDNVTDNNNDNDNSD